MNVKWKTHQSGQKKNVGKVIEINSIKHCVMCRESPIDLQGWIINICFDTNFFYCYGFKYNFDPTDFQESKIGRNTETGDYGSIYDRPKE